MGAYWIVSWQEKREPVNVSLHEKDSLRTKPIRQNILPSMSFEMGLHVDLQVSIALPHLTRPLDMAKHYLAIGPLLEARRA